MQQEILLKLTLEKASECFQEVLREFTWPSRLNHLKEMCAYHSGVPFGVYTFGFFDETTLKHVLTWEYPEESLPASFHLKNELRTALAGLKLD
jgi:hypothetical protein